ncbi:MAG: ATP-binding cassette domain-containing protein [Saprospiraceae bacterium]|nr:ATP-binding cassette domain-containing protein [Saprospiraceae bacterium]
MSIHISNTTISYDRKPALFIEDLHIPDGQKVAILGSNGSGKSTLLRALLDLIPLQSGTIKLFGSSVKESEHWKSRTSAFLDESFLLQFLTARQYINFVGENPSDQEIKVLSTLLNFHSLELGMPIRNMSSGNRRKVGILGALVSKRELLLFDEILTYLDHASQNGVVKYLDLLSDTTILIAEHDLSFSYNFADRLLILKAGQIIRDVETTMVSENDIAQLLQQS